MSARLPSLEARADARAIRRRRPSLLRVRAAGVRPPRASLRSTTLLRAPDRRHTRVDFQRRANTMTMPTTMTTTEPKSPTCRAARRAEQSQLADDSLTHSSCCCFVKNNDEDKCAEKHAEKRGGRTNRRNWSAVPPGIPVEPNSGPPDHLPTGHS